MSWREWRAIRGARPHEIQQAVVQDRSTGLLVGMRAVKRGGGIEDLVLSRWRADGKPTGEKPMQVVGGRSHGVILYAHGGLVDLDVSGHRVQLPYVSGRTWRASQLASRRRTPRPVGVARTDWCQGEVRSGDRVWRLYGVPYKATGPSLNPNGSRKPKMPGYVELIVGGRVVRRRSIAHLGREGLATSGRPVDGRLEPEGMCIVAIDGVLHLCVGVTTGGLSHVQTHRLYVEPLSAWDRPLVSLAALAKVAAVKSSKASDAVRTVEAALVAEKLLASTDARDGIWTPATTAAYRVWQRHLGYRGGDADGIPGLTSLRKLGAAHAFDVTI